MKGTNAILARFDHHEISYEMVLVVGRDNHLTAGEKQRLNWRSENVLVATRKVICMTFDGLLNQLKVRLKTLTDVAKAATTAALASAAVKPPDPIPSNEPAGNVKAVQPQSEPPEP